MTKKPSSASEWLTLRAASAQLGISPATLRYWADQGRVKTLRTPGGHRRFYRAEMRSLAQSNLPSHSPGQIDLLVHSIVGRARLEIAGGRLKGEPWYRRFDSTAKELHRELGHRLMHLLREALDEPSGDQDFIRQARTLGKEYARVSIREGLPLPETLRAFLFFRDYVFENLIELFGGQNAEPLDAYRRLSGIVNEMLVALVESYSGTPEPK